MKFNYAYSQFIKTFPIKHLHCTVHAYLCYLLVTLNALLQPVVIPRIKLVDLTDNEKDNTITLEFKEFNMVCE